MGIKYDKLKLPWLNQNGGKTTILNWITPDEGDLGTFSGGEHVGIPVKVRVSNGPMPVYSVSEGELPAGISFNPTNGNLVGIAENVSGQYAFTLRATSGNTFIERAFSMAVEVNMPPVWTTESGSLGTIFDGTEFNYSLEATDPEARDVVYSVAVGSLPHGMVLSPDGVISGRAKPVKDNATFYFTVRATDGFAYSNQSFSMTIQSNLGPVWTIPNGGQAVPLIEGYQTNYQLVATDPEGEPLTFSVLSGTIPAGMELSESGVLNGIPAITGNVPMQSYTFTVRASDGVKASDQRFVFNIMKNTPPVWGGPSVFAEASGYTFSIPLQVTDRENKAISYSVKQGETVPSGWQVIGSDLIGTAPAVEQETAFSAVLVASDGHLTAEKTFTVNVSPTAAPIWNTPSELPTILDTDLINIELDVTELNGKPLEFTVTSPLPNGIFLVGNRLTGKSDALEESTTFEFSLDVSNGIYTSSRDFSLLIEVDENPTWSTMAGSIGTVIGDRPFSYDLSATDPNGRSLSYSLAAGTLPTGLYLSREGRISGYAEGTRSDRTVTFTVAASDGATSTNREFSLLWASNKPSVWNFEESEVIVDAYENLPFSIQLTATDPDGFPVESYSTGAGYILPGKWSLNRETGRLTGIMPTVAQDTFFDVKVAAKIVGEKIPDETTFKVHARFNREPEFTVDQSIRLISGEKAATSITAVNSGNGPMTFSVVGGELPAGMSLSKNGTINGFAPSVETDTTHSVVIRANNGLKSTDREFAFVTEPNMPPVWNTDAGNIGVIIAGVSRTVFVEATDPNDLPVRYALVSGLLPAGMALNPNTGAIMGTPDIADEDVTSTFVVSASDGLLATAREFSITVSANNAPTWVTPAGSIGQYTRNKPVRASVLASDAERQRLTYSLIGTGLPTGLILNPNTGEITGQAPDVQTDTDYEVTVRASDGVLYADRAFVIQVKTDAVPVWHTPSGLLGEYLTGSPVYMQILATDPEKNTVTYSVVGGSLPPSLYLSGAVILSPNNSATIDVDQVYTFTIRASDGQGYSDRLFSIRALANTPPEWSAVHNPNLGDFIEGTDFSYTVGAIDPQGRPVAYAISAGQLPSGVSINSNTGVISGKLSNVETDTPFEFSVVATDAIRTSTALTFSGRVMFDSPPIFEDNAGATVIDSLEGTSVSYQVVARSNGVPVDYYEVVGGSLGGLSMSASGLITGNMPVVSESTSYSFTVRATGPSGKTSTRTFAIRTEDNKAPEWQTAAGSIFSDIGGTSLSVVLTATDPNGTDLEYEVISSTLPAGVSFNTATRTIEGQLPSVIEDTTYSVTIGVSDGAIRVDRTFTITAKLDLAPVFAAEPDLGVVLAGDSINISLAAIDPNGKTVTYTTSGTVPSGLVLNSVGILSGQVSATDENTVHELTVTASDGTLTTTRTFTIEARPNLPPVWVTDAVLPKIAATDEVEIQLIATDPESRNLTFTFASGSLPTGLTMGSTGLISGICGANPATFNFTVAVSDGRNSVSRAFSIEVTETQTAPDSFSEDVAMHIRFNNDVLESYVVDDGGAPVMLSSLGSSAEDFAMVTHLFRDTPVNRATGRVMPHAHAVFGVNTPSGFGGIDFSADPSAYVALDTNEGLGTASATSRGAAETDQAVGTSSMFFTHELWVKFSPRGNQYQTLYQFGGLTNKYVVQHRPSVGLVVVLGNALGPITSSPTITASGLNIADDEWHHVAVVRQAPSNTVRLYVDGMLKGTSAFSHRFTDGGSGLQYAYIGNDPTRTTGLNGIVDGIKITAGADLYRDNFTPDVRLRNRMTSMPSTSGTMPFDTIAGPEGFGSAIRAKGVGSVVAVPTNTSEFNFSDSDGEATIDLWFKTPSTLSGGTKTIFQHYRKSPSSQLTLTYVGTATSTTGLVLRYAGGSTTISNRYTWAADTWYHIAVVTEKTSSTRRTALYVNGERLSATGNQNPFAGLAVGMWLIGGDYTTRNTNADDTAFDDFRVTRAARWRENFTPPLMETMARPLINTMYLPVGEEGDDFSATIRTEIDDATFSATDLPSTLSINETTGEIAGVYPESITGIYRPRITATGPNGMKTSRLLELVSKGKGVPATGPKLVWRFTGKVGPTNVASTRSNVGGVIDATTATTSYVIAANKPETTAIRFTSNSYLAWPSQIAFREPVVAALSGEEATIEFWTYLEEMPQNTAYFFSYGGSLDIAATATGAITASGYANSLSLTSPTGSAKVGEWMHIAITRHRKGYRMFINGSLVASSSPSIMGVFSSAATAMSFGTYGGSSSTSGQFTRGMQLRNFAVYDTSKYSKSFVPTWDSYNDPMHVGPAELPWGVEGTSYSDIVLAGDPAQDRTLTFSTTNEAVGLLPDGRMEGVRGDTTETFAVSLVDNKGSNAPVRTYILPVGTPHAPSIDIWKTVSHLPFTVDTGLIDQSSKASPAISGVQPTIGTKNRWYDGSVVLGGDQTLTYPVSLSDDFELSGWVATATTGVIATMSGSAGAAFTLVAEESDFVISDAVGEVARVSRSALPNGWEHFAIVRVGSNLGVGSSGELAWGVAENTAIVSYTLGALAGNYSEVRVVREVPYSSSDSTYGVPTGPFSSVDQYGNSTPLLGWMWNDDADDFAPLAGVLPSSSAVVPLFHTSIGQTAPTRPLVQGVRTLQMTAVNATRISDLGNALASLSDGDWTFEFWLYRPAGGIMQTAPVLSFGNALSITAGTSGYLNASINGSSSLTTVVTINPSQWTHFAVTKSGTTVRFYNKGQYTTSGTVASATNFKDVSMTINATASQTSAFSDSIAFGFGPIMFTRGLKYTSNFTPVLPVE